MNSLDAVLAELEPKLEPTVFVFAVVAGGLPVPSDAVAVVEEMEGRTIIIPLETAEKKHLLRSGPMNRISLDLQTPLDMVGLTACVATTLAGSGISANVLAGFYHDHIFVPSEFASRAMEVLCQLQTEARQRLGL